MQAKPIEVVPKNELGESPIWSPNQEKLYWLDCIEKLIYSYYPKTNQVVSIKVEQIITSLALYNESYLLCTVETGYALVDVNTGKLQLLADPYDNQPVIFNDGKCDRKGRFWSGTAAKDWVSPLGMLFRLNEDLEFKTMDNNFILSNGIGFSPDNQSLYFTDSVQRTVFRYDFNLEKGTITHKKPFIIVKENEGLPDGMTVDKEGYLWIAFWDGARVDRYSPDGKKAATIPMPVPRPTSVIFGDDNYKTLYITSAKMGLTEDQLNKYPLSGSLFTVSVNVEGVPETSFDF